VAGEVDVWVVSLDRSDEEVERLHAVLVGDERERAGELPLTPRKRRYAVRQGAVREILSRYTGRSPAAIEIVRGHHGKPALGGGPDFNASDSHELAIVGVGAGGLGVDVERVVERRAARGLTGSELEAFYEKWTAREAVAKATGMGLFGLPEGRSTFRLWRLSPAPGYLATVAAAPNVDRISLRSYPGES
jgi:4'-phosphopantetheinyl transferase